MDDAEYHKDGTAASEHPAARLQPGAARPPDGMHDVRENSRRRRTGSFTQSRKNWRRWLVYGFAVILVVCGLVFLLWPW